MSKLKYYTDLESKIKTLESQLAKYKSIVKKVDADNLPRGEVLAINDRGELHYGTLFFHGQSIGCETLYEAIYDITHYIEQKDLIDLITRG